MYDSDLAMPSTPIIRAEPLIAALAAGTPPLPLFRQALQQIRSTLAERFIAGQPVTKLVQGHAIAIDLLLRHAWCHFSGGHCTELALLAVGGYGRGELHLHSDIDLLILGEESAITDHHGAIEQFLLLLWDIGLEVGHSVRSLADCERQAQADITVATNLLEARLLAGPEALYQQLRQLFTEDRIWPDRPFFEAKWREQQARHHKFHDTAYNLEPNLKEGPGGLRDIQTIGWVTKRHFAATSLQDLVSYGFLTATEYRTLIEGQNFLWRVRWGVHHITRRREDRLLFDHQRTLARLFNYQDEGGRLAVEQFMKDYYRTVLCLERLNEMLLQLFQEELLHPDTGEPPQPLNRRFQLRRGFIEVSHERVFARYPFALLELFLLLAQHPEAHGVRAETVRQLRSHRHLIDDSFRNDLRCRSLFMEILRQPHGVHDALQRMNRYGILGSYIPAFGRIVGQMQHDLFHVYTVDVHTLFVLGNLRRLSVTCYDGELPLCSRLMQERIAKPELIYLAALFHDIAKGRGGDHSELGAGDATAFCRHHLLSDYDTRLVTWLVRHHLLMSTTAQRRDISDPEEINRFASLVGDSNHLNHLYLLTVADIRATNPNLWNSWKAALLAELYGASHQALRRGLTNPLDKEELIRDTQHEARQRLAADGIDAMRLEQLWQRMDDDYFLRYAVEEIALHARAIISNPTPTEPLVLLQPQSRRGGTALFIYTAIHNHCFTTITTLLDQLGLTVVDARIIPSRDHYTLDTYLVLEESGEPISEPYRLEEIRTTLIKLLQHPEQVPTSVQRRLPRQLKQFTVATEVLFQQDQHNHRTVMEVITTDRPGLLSRIGHALASCQVQLQNAKIATFGERVEDIFFITDADGNPMLDTESQACLRETISRMLQQP